MEQKSGVSHGTVTFANDVLVKVADIAARGVSGVSDVKKLSVEENNGTVSSNISIIVEYGSTIVEIAEQVQDAVKSAIQSMTGLNVEGVNINVLSVMMK